MLVDVVSSFPRNIGCDLENSDSCERKTEERDKLKLTLQCAAACVIVY